MSIGGGWRFISNLRKSANSAGMNIVNTWQECDVVLITGATMTDRTEMQEAKKADKKIFLRIDNMPKDSNNRGTAFSRMRDFSLLADGFIFQSKWAQDYVGWWIREKVNAPNIDNSKVIYNGIDTDYFFYTDKPSERSGNKYLYVRYNRDENKRFPEACLHFHRVSRNQKDIEFIIVGKFGQESLDYNFDFFAGENITYYPPIEDPMNLANIMRQCKYLYFPCYADASPNTLHEAMACGLEPLLINPEGGSVEVERRWKIGEKYTIQDMAKDYFNFLNS